ncbi:hypothetical protein [Chryseobacterium mulctrae]|uniref:hypothetical protein n=1 Tax=Chryseobacterium mulctrae TaxID=2576777 RepID=UPI001115EE25|nr:hypothetical protein [Chryseobacterium mulctrae]
MNNVLDKNYSEISFRTDVEDLRVMIIYLNEFGNSIVENNEIKRKVTIILLKEIRDKMIIKEVQKAGSRKQFLMKFKGYHIAALLEAFQFNQRINQTKIFERNCIDTYKNQFHQKLTGL